MTVIYKILETLEYLGRIIKNVKRYGMHQLIYIKKK